MLKWLLAQLMSKLFGDGFGADVAGRGVVYLGDNLRQAIDKDDEQLTTVRLRPGESYTVIARPAATRRERKLAKAQRSLEQRHRSATHPTRKQLRAAKKLARTQHRLDKRRPGTRRHRRLEARERRRGERFDAVTRPTRRQAQLTRSLERATAELDLLRAERFAEARAHNRDARRRPRTRVFDE